MSSHGGRDLQAGQDPHEATQLLVYRGREGGGGYWRVLNATSEREKERKGRREEREGEIVREEGSKEEK